MRESSRLVLLSLIPLALVACTSQVALHYVPRDEAFLRPPAKAVPLISLGGFQDARENDHGPNWLGSIRSTFGFRLRILRTEAPTVEVVRDAFGDGLRTRQALSQEHAQYRIEGTIRKLDCNAYWNFEAHAVVDVQVVGDSGPLFSSTYRSDLTRAAKGTGIFYADELRALAERAMTEVVDSALDDPQLRRAVGW